MTTPITEDVGGAATGGALPHPFPPGAAPVRPPRAGGGAGPVPTTLDLRGPVGVAVPAAFQEPIIDGLAAALRAGPTPLLLVAPTASGKTFMLGRALQATVRDVPTLWFWFAPYTPLVAQTIASLREHCRALQPLDLSTERRRDHHAGDVLVGSAQSVAASNKEARRIYGLGAEAGGLPNLQVVVSRAKAAGLRIGLVVDEAHIGAADHTVFGRFCRDLAPSRVLLATATPDDAKLRAFVGAAGWQHYLPFRVSRSRVVQERLNKAYVEACVYTLSTRYETFADLKRTAIRQAWKKHCELRDRLRALEVPTVPLLLVQVENGRESTAEAVRFLVEGCGVPHALIAEHTADSPNPLALTRIANDPTREVLVFKEAAGTGFDAPRAFVLASMKTVRDGDFATQFLGRIMRVDRRVRALFADPDVREACADLDTGYLFLTDERVQAGYRAAVARAMQLTGDVVSGPYMEVRERLRADGSVVITTRPTPQAPLPFTSTASGASDGGGAEDDVADAGSDGLNSAATHARGAGAGAEPQQDLFGGPSRSTGMQSATGGLTEPTARGSVRTPRAHLAGPYAGPDAIATAAVAAGLRLYPRVPVAHFGGALRTERAPNLGQLGALAREVAGALEYSLHDLQHAVRHVLRGIAGLEQHEEFTRALTWSVEIEIEFDREAAARRAMTSLGEVAYMEERDRLTVLSALAQRLGPAVDEQLGLLKRSDRPTGKLRERLLRDVAHVMVGGDPRGLATAYQSALAGHVTHRDAAPLPDALALPAQAVLARSPRNLYGVLPPSVTDMRALDDAGLLNVGRPFHENMLAHVDIVGGARYGIALCDGTWAMNTWETKFAGALDGAGFVQWWHRNPQGKPYSAGVIRGDCPRPFYPDFVLCMSAFDGDAPKHRLVDTKNDMADAALKSRRVPPVYGRVAFIRREASGSKDVPDRFHMITPEGTLGAQIDDGLTVLREELRRRPPISLPH